MRNVLREAIEHPGFSFVDITSQCIENNGRRIGFASANEMLNFYRKTYKRAAKDAQHLNPLEIGILSPRPADPAMAANGNGSGTTGTPERPESLPVQPSGPMTSATASPGATGTTGAVGTATDDEKARRRAESQQRAAVMAQLTAEVKLSVAKGELTLAEALGRAGIPVPEWLRTGASAPSGAPVAPGEVGISATGEDPRTQDRPSEPAAQKGDPKEAKRAEAQRKLALMQRLPSEVKLRVAKGELTLADALREAGIDPESVA